MVKMSFLALSCVLISACGAEQDAPDAANRVADPSAEELATVPDPRDLITEEDLHRHISVLASDEFEGRLPASRGEELTLEYLTEQFTALGVESGNGDSFLQPVPLVSISADPSMTLTVSGADRSNSYAYGEQMMAGTRRVVEQVALEDSELVFVGYGVVAPEYNWNDYEGLDVEGKTVVMLVNDPGFGSGDPELFNGRAMTYYGRWTYKYEEASRQGAAGAFIIHETEPASYGWEVVSGSWSGEQFSLVTEDGNMSRVAVEGWLQEAVAREIFSNAGEDLDELKRAALSRDFEPVPLGLTASVTVENTISQSDSHNVIGVIPGSERPDEYIIYTAHWDHLGVDGTDIYNGAVDNASGTAGLLLLAEAFAAMVPPPERSIVFLAVTAEEQGLIGSAHYAANPVFPLAQTVAVINVDVLNFIGPTRDISVIGYGASELDQYVDEVAAEMGRTVMPDPQPEAGSYYRSDHFSFAKQGVPALYADMGRDMLEGGRERGIELAEQYNQERYHAPADDYSPEQDWSGGVEDLKLLFEIGRRIAAAETWPNWVEGNEFRAIRDAQRPMQ